MMLRPIPVLEMEKVAEKVTFNEDENVATFGTYAEDKSDAEYA